MLLFVVDMLDKSQPTAASATSSHVKITVSYPPNIAQIVSRISCRLLIIADLHCSTCCKYAEDFGFVVDLS